MFKKNYLAKYLTDKELNDISSAISNTEKKTSGEIRICIKQEKGYLEKEFTPRDLALKEFFNLKMNETVDKTGILFFILFDERKFEIVADEGINSKIPENGWNLISEEIIKKFSENKYFEGIMKLIESAGKILIEEFPAKENDRNELPDDVIVRS